MDESGKPGESGSLHGPSVHAEAAGTQRRVFISYASHDAAVAKKVCSALEAAGFPCWIAPRNVIPGTLYAEGIVRAINDSTILALILSAHSVASAHVGKELERATSKRHPIIVLRTDFAPLTEAFEYFLSESQWIEMGSGGIDVEIAKLVDAVGQHLSPGSSTAPTHVPEGPPVTLKAASSQQKMVIAGAVIVVVLIAAYFVADKAWLRAHSAAATMSTSASAVQDKSIAVLPFTDMSEKKDQEYFADGMSEEIIDLLVKIPGLKVIGRTSSFQFKGHNEDLRTIATQLGVAYVLEGSVRRSGDRLRVTAQLIEAKDGLHLWSETYDEDFGDVLKIQDRVAAGIVRALQVTVDSDISQRQRKLTNATTYTLYLRGRHALDRQDESGFQEAQTDFEQALALDPSYIQAAEQLVKTLAGQVAEGFVPSEIGWQRVRKAADEALRLDVNSALVHSILGLRYALYEFDFKAADSEVAQALKLSPRDPSVLGAAARLAFIHGRFDEALRLVNNSLTVDPLAPLNLQLLGDIRYFSGKFPEAEAAIREAMQISPTSVAIHYSLGLVLLAHGLPAAALKEMEIETDDGGRDAGLAIVYYSLGRHAESDSALIRLTQQHGADWAYGVAKVHSFLGARDNAFEWLDRSYLQRDSGLQFVKGDPLLTNLRGDPRYTAFLRKMNLSE